MSQETKNVVQTEDGEKKIKLLSIAEMDQFWDTLDHDECCLYQKMDVDFIKRHEEDINFALLSVNTHITFGILDAFEDKISWASICLNPKTLTDSLIYNYRGKMIWDLVLKNQQLNLKLLVVLSEIYKRVKTSPSKENRLNFWESVSRYQNLPIDYIDSYKKYINFEYLSSNKFLTGQIIDKYIFKLNPSILLRSINIPQWVLLKHKDFFTSVAKENQMMK